MVLLEATILVNTSRFRKRIPCAFVVLDLREDKARVEEDFGAVSTMFSSLLVDGQGVDKVLESAAVVL